MSISQLPPACSDIPENQDQDNEVLQEYRKDRSLIFHLIYAMEIYDYDISLASLIDNFNRGFELDIDAKGSIAEIAQAVITQRDALDEQIKPLLANWRFDRIGVCTKLILRLAIWELLNTDTDPKIVINEAIELAKCFAERDAYKFINGILDELVKRLEKGQSTTE